MAANARGLTGAAYASAKAAALREAREPRKPAEPPKGPAKAVTDMTAEEHAAMVAARPKRAAEMSQAEYYAAKSNIIRGSRR